MVFPSAIRTAGSPKGNFVLLFERYMPTRERANVVWKTTVVRKIGPVCCISYACMSENTESVTLRSKYEENDFQETSRQNAAMMLAIQETSCCGAVMTLESKFTFTSFDKETVLSFIPCHSIRCTLLLSTNTLFSVQDHWIKTISFSWLEGRIQGEHMTICVNYCIQGWISVVRTDI